MKQSMLICGAAMLLLTITVILTPVLTTAIQTRTSESTPTFHPAVSDWLLLSSSTTPPAEAQCYAINRRCFTPSSMANSYNYASLLLANHQGQGKTIAVIDSFGSDTIRSDLNVFDTSFGLQHLCGETGVICTPGMPTFNILQVQGSPPTTPPPINNGTGQENHNLWAIEVSLDVEWAHATAPKANILLVTIPTAETLGVQGLPQMMNAIEYVVHNHLADVISMSFGTGEGAFHNGLAATIMNNRQPFIDAQTNHVTLFASSGDGGTTNSMKEPVKKPANIPYPSVIWPASDPLVTAVGGTYLCTNAVTGTSVDTVNPPVRCQPTLNPGLQRETGWVVSGGGYSILFSRPTFQNLLPPGSTFVGSSTGAPGPNFNMRGIPDIAYQASATTGVLVYDAGEGGWFIVGGTSAGSPQWAGLIALADQIAGRDLGYINPALYQIANIPGQYTNDFFDVTINSNGAYSASIGWDAVTGLGTPNAANLIPDLITAIPP
ncbi:MAG: S53 family peptidase [Candidatus Bathyarchaeia archaeon]